MSATPDARGAAAAFLTQRYAELTVAEAERLAFVYVISARRVGDDAYLLAVLAGMADAFVDFHGPDPE